MSFLTDLYTKALKDGHIVVDEVIKYFQLKYPQEKVDAVFGSSSIYNSGRNDGRQFIEKLNVGEPPLVLLNGVQLDRSKLTADEFENEVLQNLVGVYSGKFRISLNFIFSLVHPVCGLRILYTVPIYIIIFLIFI